MALESRLKLSVDNFNPDVDLIEVFSRKAGVVGVITPSQISVPPSGVAGAIQFSNGSAFASDAANFFWDNTNKRLGIGTNAPVSTLNVLGLSTFVGSSGNTLGSTTAGAAAVFYQTGYAGTLAIGGYSNSGGEIQAYQNNGTYLSGSMWLQRQSGNVLIGSTTDNAKLVVRGSGSTSATTSLLVQNSAGSQRLKVSDNGLVSIAYIDNFPAGVWSNEPSFGTYGMLIGCVTNAGDTAIFTKGNNSGSSALRVTDQNIGASRNHLLVDWVGSTGFNLPNGTKVVEPSAQVEIQSTTKGFLKPRMTTAEINAIVSPANGLEVYNTTLACPCFYDGTAWRKVSHTTM